MRPAWTPSSGYDVSNPLLESEFETVKKIVNTKVKNATYLTLQFDTWSNVRREAIMNFILGTPDVVYYHLINVGPNKEDAIYIHDVVKDVIDEVSA